MPKLLRARALGVGTATALALTLAACAEEPEPVAQSTWQITDVYTTPGIPSGVHDSVGGAVFLSFGNRTMAGYTGCAPLNGIVSFTDGDAPATPEHATKMHVTDVAFRAIDEETCTGHVRYTHDALVHLLVDGSFTIRHEANGVMVLTADSQQVDPPAIHLVAQDQR